MLNTLVNLLTSTRLNQLSHFRQHPHEVQMQVLAQLVSQAKETEWGKNHGYAATVTPEQYRQRVSLSEYDDLAPFIKRMMRGEQNILWPSPIKWYAKSSGTTSDRSKFIPVSQEALEECHFRGGKDLIMLHLSRHPESRLYLGKAMSVGGTLQHAAGPDASVYSGAISAIVTKNLPLWAELGRTPPLDMAFLPWEQKLEQMATLVAGHHITSILGLPTWTHLLLERVLEITGKSHLLEVWPGLELFAHGGVAFGPYRELFRTLIPSDQVSYIDVYNASEGFFGLQDGECEPDEMLLMLDNGVYYEFIPIGYSGKERSDAIGLESVKVGENYALVISTNAGLWRYKIGDTIRFTSTSPYRFKISGRTKHYMNAFGEELMMENAERAIARASKATGALVKESTAGPMHVQNGRKGRHEWLVEFIRAPDSIAHFTVALDKALRELNSDYDSRRHQDMALLPPLVRPVAEGTFYCWMKRRGKLGGQHKVPRLSTPGSLWRS